MDHAAHLDQLAPELRLALAYAPAAARDPTLGLFALDVRLAGIVRASREPMLAQLRLAWWREQLSAPAHARPAGEPLLALLDAWREQRSALTALVDGWESLIGEAPLSPAALDQFIAGRASACAALARSLDAADNADQAERAGRCWAAVDLAARLSHPEERASAQALLKAIDWRRPALQRALRPLAVLQALARRGRDGAGLLSRPSSVFIALRVGLLGI